MITIKDFDSSRDHVKALKDKFNENESRHGFNLTEHLDGKAKTDFDQGDISEIVLWKINRYVNIQKSLWFEKFNKLKGISALEEHEIEVKKILTEMLATNGIQLPMASTMLRFRNPEVFQVIDARTFRIFFGGDDDFLQKEKQYYSTNKELKIDIYLEYLRRLRKYCDDNKEVKFFDADRIFYQYDIRENKVLKIL